MRHTWPHPTKSDSLRFSRWLILCIKNQYINWFLSEILLIKESCNLIRQDEQLTKGGILRSYIPLMIVSMYKQLRYQSIPSWDIGNSRILQSDWTRTNQNISLSPSFSWQLSAGKKLRYQFIPSKNTDDQRILQSDWLRVFLVITEEPDYSKICGFHRIIKHTVMHHF